MFRFLMIMGILSMLLGFNDRIVSQPQTIDILFQESDLENVVQQINTWKENNCGKNVSLAPVWTFEFATQAAVDAFVEKVRVDHSLPYKIQSQETDKIHVICYAVCQ